MINWQLHQTFECPVANPAIIQEILFRATDPYIAKFVLLWIYYGALDAEFEAQDSLKICYLLAMKSDVKGFKGNKKGRVFSVYILL